MWTRGKRRIIGVYVLFLGESEEQNRLLWNALRLLLWKPGHVFLACKTSVLTRFFMGTHCSCWEKGSLGTAFSSCNSRPHRQVRKTLLNSSRDNPRVYMATDFSLAKLFSNTKQKCPGVRLAAKKVQTVESAVIKEWKLGSNKGKSEHCSFQAMCL